MKKIKNLIKNNYIMLKYIFKLCPSHIFIAITISLFSATIPIINLFFTRFIINETAVGKVPNVVFQNIIVYCGIILSVNVLYVVLLSFLNNYIVPKNIISFKEKMQAEIFDKSSAMELFFYDKPNFFNKFSIAIQQSDSRALDIVSTLSLFISNLFTISSISVIMGAFEPIILLFISISVLISFISNTKLINAQHNFAIESIPLQRVREYVKRMFYLKEYAKELRIFTGLQKIFKHMYTKSTELQKKIIKNHAQNLTVSTAIQGIASNSLNIATILFLSFKTLFGNLLIGDFVMLLTGAQQLANQILNLLNIFPQMYEHSLYIENFLDFMNQPTDSLMWGSSKLNRINEISLNNVDFAYPNSSSILLSNVNLSLKSNMKIAIVGYNGAGKSTIAKILMGLYAPTKGNTLINGKEITAFRKEDVLKQVSVVFQESPVFSVTVAENVLARSLSTPADITKVIKALKFAGLYDKVKNFPNGINTIVSQEFDETGTCLSGGEMQKLSLARAFAKNSSLIILDEPSSALDPIAENEMFSKLNTISKDKCTIIITHRLSNITNVNRIYVVDKGKVVESGTHIELMKNNGLYSKMYNHQSENQF